MTREQIRFVIVVLAVVLAFIVGTLLVLGRHLLVPIFAAVIAVYVLVSAAEALGRVPGIGRLPSSLRRMLVLLCFTLAFLGLGLVAASTIDQLIDVAPTYRENFDAILAEVTGALGMSEQATWEDIRALTVDRIDVQALVTGLLGSVTSFGGSLFLIVVYAGFLMAERDAFARKARAAFPAGAGTDHIRHMLADINRKIADYLAVKTLVNVIGGAISYVVMLAVGLDFALFWATLIALLNYIPYIGSLVAVALPLLLSLAQFGSIETTLVLAALLIGAQLISDNLIEPRLIGRQLDLSPFVVLVALSFWSAIWGLSGAILAIPLTSMLAIIFSGFPATRFISIFLAGHAPDEAKGGT
ncbi:MAG: AI-2E family transporter [Bauldia sp.]|nr:AI-2E family transporter [Bauldia sp.]